MFERREICVPNVEIEQLVVIVQQQRYEVAHSIEVWELHLADIPAEKPGLNIGIEAETPNSIIGHFFDEARREGVSDCNLLHCSPQHMPDQYNLSFVQGSDRHA
ncbi:hypothetical protein PQH74_19595 [Cupriavidus metallidurans]|nr:hypothetical protein [Cupriavidus metallidurans]MDE4920117.1 hypothetical protein [Cupriavidus metallidurans]